LHFLGPTELALRQDFPFSAKSLVAAFAAALIACVYAFFKVGVFPMPEFKVISPYEPSGETPQNLFCGDPI
jgi:hypothetical protein